jgi:hypothetical protein
VSAAVPPAPAPARGQQAQGEQHMASVLQEIRRAAAASYVRKAKPRPLARAALQVGNGLIRLTRVVKQANNWSRRSPSSVAGAVCWMEQWGWVRARDVVKLAVAAGKGTPAQGFARRRAQTAAANYPSPQVPRENLEATSTRSPPRDLRAIITQSSADHPRHRPGVRWDASLVRRACQCLRSHAALHLQQLRSGKLRVCMEPRVQQLTSA